MARLADIVLSWKRSVSGDIVKKVLTIIVDGEKTETEFGPEVEEYRVSIAAQKSAQWWLTNFDAEGNKSTSVVASFTLGDLESPQPETDLRHEIVGVRDVPDLATAIKV